MNKFLAAFFTLLISQLAFADMISISCSNTKLPAMKSIQLANGEDFGKSGSTSGNWSLTINQQEVKDAYVKVLGHGSSVSGLTVTFANRESLSFAFSGDSKAFVFKVSKRGNRIEETASYCSMDID